LWAGEEPGIRWTQIQSPAAEQGTSQIRSTFIRARTSRSHLGLGSNMAVELHKNYSRYYDLYLLYIYMGFECSQRLKQLNFDFTKCKISIPTYISHIP
jgi:hypothetical protein